MEKKTFNTGRYYNGAQILDCTVVDRDDYTCDIFNETYSLLTVHVIDESRGMEFTVVTFNELTMERVLRPYDEGVYKLV